MSPHTSNRSVGFLENTWVPNDVIGFLSDHCLSVSWLDSYNGKQFKAARKLLIAGAHISSLKSPGRWSNVWNTSGIRLKGNLEHAQFKSTVGNNGDMLG